MNVTIKPDGWDSKTPEAFDGIWMVVRSIIQVFYQHFGPRVLELPDLTILHHDADPDCLRQAHTIRLNTRDSLWSQCAYQFSHEFCHYQIPKDLQRPLRWFEESLCEAASYFFMECMAHLWQERPPLPGCIPYAPSLITYIRDDQKKARAFNLDYTDPLNPYFDLLTNNEYMRDLNAYVAIHLLPIFQDMPDLWRAVPLLAALPASNDFTALLTAWHAIADAQCSEGIKRIAKIFNITLP